MNRADYLCALLHHSASAYAPLRSRLFVPLLSGDFPSPNEPPCNKAVKITETCPVLPRKAGIVNPSKTEDKWWLESEITSGRRYVS